MRVVKGLGGYGIKGLRPYYAPNPLCGGAWPPKTYPRPFSNVAPRRDGCPLTRGNSKGARNGRIGGPPSLRASRTRAELWRVLKFMKADGSRRGGWGG